MSKLNKMNYVKSMYKHVASVRNNNIQSWYININGVSKSKFDTERKAAIAVDKLLIGRGKEPVNILTRLKK
tara:strand:- start:5663 stop:5875 length:213 start_codon:yes stop_codon:yes gene_type:complete